jgi:hypothetical protein
MVPPLDQQPLIRCADGFDAEMCCFGETFLREAGGQAMSPQRSTERFGLHARCLPRLDANSSRNEST